jgi:hypothetical protein
MHETSPSKFGAGQAPLDSEALARIERELWHHAEQYLEVMLRMWIDSDQDARAHLEKLYVAASGEDLAKIAKERAAETLLKKP